jgi:hypothetical protein
VGREKIVTVASTKVRMPLQRNKDDGELDGEYSMEIEKTNVPEQE